MPAPTPARRIVTTGRLEVRTEGDQATIEGYASTFGQPYDMGWYTETVRSGRVHEDPVGEPRRPVPHQP
jgi:hypothetical protein